MTELEQLRKDVESYRNQINDMQQGVKDTQNRATREIALAKVLGEQWELRALRAEKNAEAWEKLFRCADEQLEKVDPTWVARADCPDCVKAQQALGVMRKKPDGKL